MPDDAVTIPSTVEICFGDQGIAQLFSELLLARNIPSTICSPEELRCSGKVITERRYFHLLKDMIDPENCLVVENSSMTTAREAVTLVRPLTVEKIEYSLRTLFSGTLSRQG